VIGRTKNQVDPTLTSTVLVVVREIRPDRARKLQDVVPLIAVDDFVVGLSFEELLESGVQGPDLAKEQLQQSLGGFHVQVLLVLILWNEKHSSALNKPHVTGVNMRQDS
jgi:hypothetical protein